MTHIVFAKYQSQTTTKHCWIQILQTAQMEASLSGDRV